MSLTSASRVVIACLVASRDVFESSSSALRATFFAFDDESLDLVAEFGLSAMIIWLCKPIKRGKKDEKEKRGIKAPKYAITIV